MSIQIHEKITQIREQKGLTRDQFAAATGVPVNTLKSIEQKGVVPRSDVLEKIALRWPEYAHWLLTGTSGLEGLDVLSFGASTRFRIIDSVDPRFMEQCIVKPGALNKLIFISSKEQRCDVAAMLLVSEDVMYRISSTPNIRAAIWVQPGHMNFESDHGGRLVLRDFRQWVGSLDEDLIANAEMWRLQTSFFDDVYKVLHVPGTLLEKPDMTSLVYQRFKEWVSGNDMYV